MGGSGSVSDDACITNAPLRPVDEPLPRGTCDMKEEPELDYGPLAALIGNWEGDKGVDIAPEPEGPEESPYYEEIVFEAAGDVENAERQELAVVRYHQVVRRKSNDEVFHDQVGYWTWDAKTNVVVQSLTIPRNVCVLAGGEHPRPDAGAAEALKVSARKGDADWGIIESPFMRDNATTTSFEHTLTVEGDTLTYAEMTMLHIYGREFEHTDTNTLVRRSRKA